MARFYLSVSLLFYLLALCFDAVHLAGGSAMPALQMLLQGPWGIVFGLFGWFANPLFGLALLVRRRWRWFSLLLGLWSLYLALASHGIERLPDNHSYSFHDVSGFAAGYYLWVIALGAFCAGQAWWCSRGRASEVPRWSLADGGLALLLLVVVIIGLRDADLRFDIERAFEWPSPSSDQHTPRKEDTI
ncbi:hypothetical protein [Pseudomonas sp. Irchel 3E13]|uniref:hypothetical protein n=1 Tax=Pseudomonas sp. Irchel 3E13 TaxID=2008975 RepID=UPI000BA39E30|nr:hypothetical protein [Pseudomonas sp. Irchel 3E13]